MNKTQQQQVEQVFNQGLACLADFEQHDFKDKALLKKASEHLSRAHRLNPYDIRSPLTLAYLFTLLGDLPTANQFLESARAIHKNHPGLTLIEEFFQAIKGEQFPLPIAQVNSYLIRDPHNGKLCLNQNKIEEDQKKIEIRLKNLTQDFQALENIPDNKAQFKQAILNKQLTQNQQLLKNLNMIQTLSESDLINYSAMAQLDG